VSLKIYTIHKKSVARIVGNQNAGEGPDVILVPEGFSFGAFLFQELWALYHRLWLVALAMLVVVYGGFTLLVMWLDPELGFQIALDLIIALLIGAEARNIWRWDLTRRGYRMEGVVMGESLEDAERRYFEETCFDGMSHSIGAGSTGAGSTGADSTGVYS
jgi:hypothetical protein